MDGLEKSRYHIVFVAGGIFVIFLCCCLMFILYMRSDNKEKSCQYLIEATSQCREAVGQQMNGDMEILRGIAVFLSTMDEANEKQTISLLKQINQEGHFRRMGIFSLDGTGYMIDEDGSLNRDLNFSRTSFFQDSLEGKAAISSAVFDSGSNQYINYMSTPFSARGGGDYILVAVNSEDVFLKYVDEPVYNSSGYYAIINSEGTVMFPETSRNPEVFVGASIFSIGEFTAQEHHDLAAAVQNEREGCYSFAINGVRQIITLQPLHIQDWIVIGAIEESIIEALYNSVMTGAFTFIIVACLVFCSLMYWQVRTTAVNQRKLENLAYTDQVTGLRNYVKFRLDAQEILNRNPHKAYAVWCFDTKDFSRINAIFGSARGDLVLKRIGHCLDFGAPADAILCRMAADHFIGIRPYRDHEELITWFWEVIFMLSKREVIASEEMRIDDVMGVYCQDDFSERLSIDSMVNNAIMTKREAKKQIGSAIQFFTTEMRDMKLWKTELEATAKKAMENGEITFFLQPKVSIQEENKYQIVSAEVLARWQHPKYGMISPGEFIPLFESNGFITELDRYLFEQACKWFAQYQEKGKRLIRLAINVSRLDVLKDDFVSYYTRIKEKYGIEDKVLELEFTESLLLNGYESFSKTVMALQANGFICSIDDFGSGYSSLNALKNLPIDVIKLDALFFQDIHEMKREEVVISNFVNMAKQLSIRTVAEGVETVKQVDFLQEIGCDMVQGYVFSRPVSQDNFAELMERTDGVLAMEEIK